MYTTRGTVLKGAQIKIIKVPTAPLISFSPLLGVEGREDSYVNLIGVTPVSFDVWRTIVGIKKECIFSAFVETRRSIANIRAMENEWGICISKYGLWVDEKDFIA